MTGFFLGFPWKFIFKLELIRVISEFRQLIIETADADLE